MEIEKKKEQKEKVRKRKKLSDEMEENEEKKRKETFLKNWKEREERKERQKVAQEGWRKLLEIIENWEEMVLEEMEGKEVIENLINTILEEVAAFIELAEEDGNVRGTVPPSPPDRQGELNEMRREIIRLEGEIKTYSERGIVQLNIKTDKSVGTVPPYNHTKN